MKATRRNPSENGEKRGFFSISRRAVIFFLASSLLAVPALLVGNESGPIANFGDYLLILALSYWCIAWFSWLRQDGLAIFNPGSFARLFRTQAEEWKHRIPVSLVRGDSGKERIAVSASERKVPVDPAQAVESPDDASGSDGDTGEDAAASRIESKRLAVDLALAGFGIFCASLLFQYGIARIV